MIPGATQTYSFSLSDAVETVDINFVFSLAAKNIKSIFAVALEKLYFVLLKALEQEEETTKRKTFDRNQITFLARLEFCMCTKSEENTK